MKSAGRFLAIVSSRVWLPAVTLRTTPITLGRLNQHKKNSRPCRQPPVIQEYQQAALWRSASPTCSTAARFKKGKQCLKPNTWGTPTFFQVSVDTVCSLHCLACDCLLKVRCSYRTPQGRLHTHASLRR